MSDNTTEDQLTVEDILSEAEDTPYNPVLKVWREVLESSKEVRKERITPQWATRVIAGHSGIQFEDMPHYRDLYYDKIDQLTDVLQAEIDTDDECLKHTSIEEDGQNNNTHYLNVIIGWQKTILTWELDWDCTHVDAAIELATIADVHKMFFGDVGLASLLDQINFEFTDDAQELLFKELEDLKQNWDNNE
jgi:hypothetical protein